MANEEKGFLHKWGWLPTEDDNLWVKDGYVKYYKLAFWDELSRRDANYRRAIRWGIQWAILWGFLTGVISILGLLFLLGPGT